MTDREEASVAALGACFEIWLCEAAGCDKFLKLREVGRSICFFTTQQDDNSGRLSWCCLVEQVVGGVWVNFVGFE